MPDANEGEDSVRCLCHQCSGVLDASFKRHWRVRKRHNSTDTQVINRFGTLANAPGNDDDRYFHCLGIVCHTMYDLAKG